MTAKVVLEGPGDCAVVYEPDVLGSAQAALLWADLEALDASFDSGPMLVDGEWRDTTRRVLGFGDRIFAFPDMAPSLEWPSSLRAVRDRLEQQASHPFNYALVNWYPEGAARTGWHADKATLHVADSSIAILSLGATRPLCFRLMEDPANEIWQPLAARSVLWMLGGTQRVYEHAVPPVSDLIGPRMSVTFRYLVDSAGRAMETNA